MTHRVVIDGGPLSIGDVAAVAERRAEVVVDHKVWERMAPAREVVERAVAEDRIVYGVTTGSAREGPTPAA